MAWGSEHIAPYTRQFPLPLNLMQVSGQVRCNGVGSIPFVQGKLPNAVPNFGMNDAVLYKIARLMDCAMVGDFSIQNHRVPLQRRAVGTTRWVRRHPCGSRHARKLFGFSYVIQKMAHAYP